MIFYGNHISLYLTHPTDKFAKFYLQDIVASQMHTQKKSHKTSYTTLVSMLWFQRLKFIILNFDRQMLSTYLNMDMVKNSPNFDKVWVSIDVVNIKSTSSN